MKRTKLSKLFLLFLGIGLITSCGKTPVSSEDPSSEPIPSEDSSEKLSEKPSSEESEQPPSESEEKQVTVEISGPEEVEAGKSITLVATVTNAEETGVVWSGDVPGVATISEAGVVTAAVDVAKDTSVVFKATSKADEKVSATHTVLVKAAPVDITIKRGDAAEAIANPGVYYLLVGEKVTVSDDSVVDGVLGLKIVAGEEALYDAVTLFYKNPGATAGSRYLLSLTVNSLAPMSELTINGQVEPLVRGDNKISFSFEETEDASLAIIFGSVEGGLYSNTYTLKEITLVEKTYTPLSELEIDGDLSDWEGTRAAENTVYLQGSTEEYAHKSVRFYAALDEDGLYVAAHVFHDLLKNDPSKLWWQNSNFEFFVAGGNQYWIVELEAQAHKKVDKYAFVTIPHEEEGVAKYETIVEGFISLANLPENAVLGKEVRVGFAWKTEGDLITGGEANGGNEDAYWVPKGTWPNNNDQLYVSYNGAFKETHAVPVEMEKPITYTIDGDLSDWAESPAYTTNYAYLEGTGDTNHKSVKFFASLTEEGLYLAAEAYHDSYIDDGDAWHTSTNFEFFINGNQSYLSAKGGLELSNALYTGAIVSVENTGEGVARYHTIAEVFIPSTLIGHETESIKVGFAWKTNGDTMTGGGGSDGAADAWWFVAGHWPSNINEAYVVTLNGLNAA